MSWLDEILLTHAELESPTSFWYWSALAAISAVVKDNVWLDRQLYKLYPNIYVMLHADSGLKKGPPVAMAKNMVKEVNNTRIISGRSSIQGILKRMGTAYTLPGGKVMDKSVAFICSSELSSSIVEDKVATTILTDLYDRHYNIGDWESLLKMENFKLKDPIVTMLTATNEAHSSNFFTNQDVQGGYFARTFIINESKRHRANSLVNPLANVPDDKKAAQYLKEIETLRGEFEPLHKSPVGEFYNDWYNDFIVAVDARTDKDETGTLNRFGDSVLKVAMLLSLALEPVLKISMASMQQAIAECEKLVGNIRKATFGKRGKSEFTSQKALIIEEILKRDTHMISRPQLLKKFWMEATAEDWDKIMFTFDQAGMIKTQTTGNVIMYHMPDEVVKQMTDFMKGKN